MTSKSSNAAKTIMQRPFKKYGLQKAIRIDNRAR